MVLPNVTHGTAIAHYQVLKAPLVAQNLLQQSAVSVTRFVIERLISTHHLAHLGFLNERFECGKIGFPQITRRHIVQIGRVTRIFGPAVHGIMLCTSPQFAILTVFRSLQTTHNRRSHHSRQIGIFTVGFLSTSPSWVAKNIHIGCPNRQTMELFILASVPYSMMILSPHLITCCAKHLI